MLRSTPGFVTALAYGKEFLNMAFALSAQIGFAIYENGIGLW